MQVQSSGKETIYAGSVLVALFRERDSHALYLLEKQGVTRLGPAPFISHGALKVRDESGLRPHSGATTSCTRSPRATRRTAAWPTIRSPPTAST